MDLQHLRTRPMERLSGGERRRAWLAMVLCQRAEILLLDEPIGSLDIRHRFVVLGHLARLNREWGVTMFIVLHELELAAALAHRIATFTRGRLYEIAHPAHALRGEMLLDVFGVEGTFHHDRGATRLDVHAAERLLTVRRPGTALGVVSHSIISGILPAPELLEAKTAEFRRTYERSIPNGARTARSCTACAEPRCSLTFYVFNLERQNGVDRFRCLQVDARAEVLRDVRCSRTCGGTNTLFHGKAENSVVVHFRHQQTVETAWGGFQVVS